MANDKLIRLRDVLKKRHAADQAFWRSGDIDGISGRYRIPAAWARETGFDGTGPGLYLHSVKKALSRPENELPRQDEYVMAQVFLQHLTAYQHVRSVNDKQGGRPGSGTVNDKQGEKPGAGIVDDKQGQEQLWSDDGTLLKTISILPILENAGVNSIMLMPHFLRSETNRKGNRGSPYSVRDYYRIDQELVDNMTSPELSAEDMFGAFVEAAHQYGMRVIIDMVPRTAARDSLWILENPEWFYWIKPENRDELIELLQTDIKGLHNPSGVNADNIKQILEGLPLREIARIFEWAPSVSDPEGWAAFRRERCSEDSRGEDDDLFEAIIHRFGLMTPPGTSDCVNDPQPPWTDVTPLRLFQDYSPEITEALHNIGITDTAKVPPFFIQPVLKSSNFPGRHPVSGLWEQIGSVTRYYHQKFGVDGVRGDMFHALPSDLISEISRDLPENFLLIMENLCNKDGEALSVKHGFQMYTGNFFTMVSEGPDKLEFFVRETASYKTRVLAMPVLHDTTPLFSRPDNMALFQLAVAAFMPNSTWAFQADTLIPNRLPVNFGLGFSPEDQRIFSEKLDKAGRKLAMFYHDTLTTEWDEYDGKIVAYVNAVARLRKKLFVHVHPQPVYRDCELLEDRALIIRYSGPGEKSLYVYANASPESIDINMSSLAESFYPVNGFAVSGSTVSLEGWGLGLVIR